MSVSDWDMMGDDGDGLSFLASLRAAPPAPPGRSRPRPPPPPPRVAPPAPSRQQLTAALGPPPGSSPSYSGGDSTRGGGDAAHINVAQTFKDVAAGVSAAQSVASALSSFNVTADASLNGELTIKHQPSGDVVITHSPHGEMGDDGDVDFEAPFGGEHYTIFRNVTPGLPGGFDPFTNATFGDDEISEYLLNAGVAGYGQVSMGGDFGVAPPPPPPPRRGAPPPPPPRRAAPPPPRRAAPPPPRMNSWQRWQEIHPGSSASDYVTWWEQYGQHGASINGEEGSGSTFGFNDLFYDGVGPAWIFAGEGDPDDEPDDDDEEEDAEDFDFGDDDLESFTDE